MLQHYRHLDCLYLLCTHNLNLIEYYAKNRKGGNKQSSAASLLLKLQLWYLTQNFRQTGQPVKLGLRPLRLLTSRSQQGYVTKLVCVLANEFIQGFPDNKPVVSFGVYFNLEILFQLLFQCVIEHRDQYLLFLMANECVDGFF